MIDCKSFVTELKEDLKKRVQPNTKLVVIQVGDNQASNSYIKGKKKDCEEVGIECIHIKFEENIITEEVIDCINEFNADKDCYGIIVQLPLPEHLDKIRILSAIDDSKDVDGFKVTSPFTSCTPKGVMMLLDHLKVDLEGKVVTVLGRSKIVGKPLVNLLIDRGATVISCNSHTKDISNWTLESDIIVSAVGKHNLLHLYNCWSDSESTDYYSIHSPKQQMIIDVGINRDDNGKLCGDCDKELYDHVDLITPTPNGVGLLTRVALLCNVIEAREIKE